LHAVQMGNNLKSLHNKIEAKTADFDVLNNSFYNRL